jgi:hypothetical protein
VRQDPALSLVGNPQSNVDLQASGSGIGQSSELSQLTSIMMSIVGRLDATVSRLDVTQGQVAELLDSERVAVSHRRGIQLRQMELNQDQTSTRHDSSPPSLRVTRNTKGGASNQVSRKGGHKKSDKKTVCVCSYYNAQKCKFDSNHELGDIFWLHVCSKCRNPGHVDTDCSFLGK